MTLILKKRKKKRNLLLLFYQNLLKILLNVYFFAMMVIKMILQIIEFYLMIIITNIIIGYNIIFICSRIYIRRYLIKSLFFSILFSYISINLLTIYYFEFSKLSWINNNVINESIIPYISKETDITIDSNADEASRICETDYWALFFLFLRIIFILPYEYKFRFRKDLKIETEIVLIFFLILFPGIKIVNIYYTVLKNKRIEIEAIGDFPFFKFIIVEIDGKNDIYKITNNSILNILFKIGLMIFRLIYHFIILYEKKESILGYFFVLFIYFFCFPFFIFLKIDPWFINLNNNSNNLDEANKTINKNIKKSKMIVIMLYSIINLFLIYQIYKISYTSSKNKTIQKIFNKTSNFTGFHWDNKNNISNQNILSPVCYTKIYYLNFIQLTSLANAAYLKDEIDSENNIIKAFKSSIFNKNDSYIDLRNLSFLTNYSDLVSILKANFRIPRKKPLTILSIKGSTTPFDFLVDIDMFISSAFFSIARKIPLLFKSETLASYVFSYLCLLSFKFLKNLTLTKNYSNKIDDIFKSLTKLPGYGINERNYVFVGHSLGGGLAKLAGFKYNLQNFSTSGPGFTPLEFYIGDKKKKFDKYFKTTFIDLVPDLDIVPRVEISGGSVYRVLCEKRVFSCHQITRTLCILGVMCNQEHLTGDLCKGVYTNKEYEEDFIKVKERKY